MLKKKYAKENFTIEDFGSRRFRVSCAHGCLGYASFSELGAGYCWIPANSFRQGRSRKLKDLAQCIADGTGVDMDVVQAALSKVVPARSM